MTELIDNLRAFAIGQAPRIVIALTIAILGWILALALGGIVRRTVDRSPTARQILSGVVGARPNAHADAAKWAGRLTYWVVLLFALLGLLQYVQLTSATQPIAVLLNSVFVFVPRVVGAIVILAFALVLAAVVRRVARGALERWGVDGIYAAQTGLPRPPDDLSDGAEPDAQMQAATTAVRPADGGLGATIASAAYWLTLLVFIPAIVGTLGLSGLLEPARAMLAEILGYLPNLGSAALILAVGWLVARVLQRIVVHALVGAGIDRLGARGTDPTTTQGRRTPSSVAGTAVYALLLLPVAVAALNALELDAVTAPASRMLGTFLQAVPALFGTALVLILAYVLGRLVSDVVRNLLRGIGFDRIAAQMGIAESATTTRSPSSLAGTLVMVVVLAFAVIEGARLLSFDAFADVATAALVFGGHILLGLVIFGVGLFVATWASNAIVRSEVRQAERMAVVARLGIGVFAGAIALRQMGLANEIIELAFGIGFGAVAVAAALAFGLGGRDAAARTLARLQTHRPRKSEPGAAAAE